MQKFFYENKELNFGAALVMMAWIIMVLGFTFELGNLLMRGDYAAPRNMVTAVGHGTAAFMAAILAACAASAVVLSVMIAGAAVTTWDETPYRKWVRAIAALPVAAVASGAAFLAAHAAVDADAAVVVLMVMGASMLAVAVPLQQEAATRAKQH